MTLIIEKPTGAKLNLAQTFTWNETVWNPSMITTALWLDAADASTVTADGSNLVSQVNDKSGNSRHFTASSGARPTYSANTLNGRGVFTYGGSQWLTSNASAATWNFLHQSGGAETIGVWKAGNTADPNAVYMFWGTNAGSVLNQGNYQRWDDRAANSFNDAVAMAAASSGSSGSSFYLDTSANGAHPANTATILGSSLNLGSATAADKLRHVVNGTVLAGTNTNAASPSTTTASFTLQIGAGGNNVLPLTGYIAEFIISATQLSTLNRQKLEGYLAHKWGLTANLPSDHPYKTVGPTP
jgi:cyclophilin family peptidyl-prolyl cis-trans isomerase